MNIVPLPAPQMAAIAPNWAAMRIAIASCERMDEIKSLSDKAIAMRAYFVQSGDIENEVAAMRVRLRAERRLGELIASEQEAGRLAGQGGDRKSNSRPTSLKQIGIPHDRSARAQQLALVPEDEFEAALAKPKPSSRAIAKLGRLGMPKSAIDVQPVLKTWGMLRDLAAAINDATLLPAAKWSKHPGIQAFQVAEIRASLPIIVDYLSQLAMEE